MNIPTFKTHLSVFIIGFVLAIFITVSILSTFGLHGLGQEHSQLNPHGNTSSTIYSHTNAEVNTSVESDCSRLEEYCSVSITLTNIENATQVVVTNGNRQVPLSLKGESATFELNQDNSLVVLSESGRTRTVHTIYQTPVVESEEYSNDEKADTGTKNENKSEKMRGNQSNPTVSKENK